MIYRYVYTGGVATKQGIDSGVEGWVQLEGRNWKGQWLGMKIQVHL